MSLLSAKAIHFEKLAPEGHAAEDEAYLSQVVLPDLHAKGELESLAHLACSCRVHVRLQALHLISSLLLEVEQPLCASNEMLKKVEEILFTSIQQQYKDPLAHGHQTGFVSEHLDCTGILATVYLTLVAVCLLRMDISPSGAFVRGILQRPLFQMSRTSSIKNFLKLGEPVPGWYNAVKACLTAWSTTSNLTRVRSRVTRIERSSQTSAKPHSPWHEVAGWSWELKLPLLVRSFVKVS